MVIAQQEDRELDALIERAMKKVGAKKENDICHYLPSSKGGYVHHFTMKKMKKQNRKELFSLIQNYIINTDRPLSVTPRPRASRGSRRRRDHLVFSKQDIEKLLLMAKSAGDKDIVRKLMPKQDLKSLKRQLISSIKHNRIEQDLWDSYVQVIHSQSQLAAIEAAQMQAGAAVVTAR